MQFALWRNGTSQSTDEIGLLTEKEMNYMMLPRMPNQVLEIVCDSDNNVVVVNNHLSRRFALFNHKITRNFINSEALTARRLFLPYNGPKMANKIIEVTFADNKWFIIDKNYDFYVFDVTQESFMDITYSRNRKCHRG